MQQIFPDATVSLTHLPIGGSATVRFIGFELLRHECGRLGLVVGGPVRVLARSASHVVISAVGGRPITLASDWGRFIQVEVEDPPAVVGDPLVDQPGTERLVEIG